MFASLFLSIFFTLNLFGEDGDVDLLKIAPITLKYETVRDNTDKIYIYKISFYLNKENADSELIHVDHIVKSSYLLGSPIRHFHRYFRINDSRIALIFIEKELIITGAKLVILEKILMCGKI